MKILVCIKQVPDADSPFRLNASKTGVETANLSWQINDYDRYALEEALRIKDAGEAEVVAVSVGPDRAGQALKTALAMGADRAIHVNDPAAEGTDPLGTARILRAAASDGFDLILTGLQADDDNCALVGPMLARLLEIPCATGVIGLQMGDDGRSVRVERELENNQVQVVEISLPALLSVQTGINAPRYASLKGIMAAKKKEIRTATLADLGIAGGGDGTAMKILEMSPPPKGKGGEMLTGSPDEVAGQIVARIRQKTGVI